MSLTKEERDIIEKLNYTSSQREYAWLEVWDLLDIIDRLLVENKALVEAGESVLAEVNFDDDRGAYIITEFVLLRLSEAVRKVKGEK